MNPSVQARSGRAEDDLKGRWDDRITRRQGIKGAQPSTEEDQRTSLSYRKNKFTYNKNRWKLRKQKGIQMRRHWSHNKMHKK